MAIITKYTSSSGFVGANQACGLSHGKIAFLVVVQGDAKAWDMADAALWKTKMEDGTIKTIFKCRGNLAAGSTSTKQASGTRSDQNTGTAFSHPVIIDNYENAMGILNQICQPCANYGAILVFKDYTAAVILDNTDDQNFLPVRYDFNGQSEGSETSTREASGTVNWTALHKEFYTKVPSEVFLSPTAPSGLVSANEDADSFDVTFDAVAGATQYRLDVATDLAFTSKVVGFDDKVITSSGGVTETTTVDGLAASTSYFVRVRAVNGAGTSANSKIIQVLTTA
ncbi:fibronectin type III domain-containing protein [Limibacter armeniacum]|uniref:fibronectin type III domain-containing protein n=1 Tax=Limibacter armeniacum TaxID=466084 RepID=UPI002FE6C0C6